MKILEARVVAAMLVAGTAVPLACGGDDEARKPPPGSDAGDARPGGSSGSGGASGSGGVGGRGGTGADGGTSGLAGTAGADSSAGTSGSGGSAGTSDVDGSAGTGIVDGSAGTNGTGGTPGDGAPSVTLSELPVGLSMVARTSTVCDIIQDGANNFLFTEPGPSANNRIRRLSADFAQITTFAGGVDPGSTDATGAAARFSTPCGLAIDAQDNLYVADSANATIRKVTPAGVVSTLAGLANQRGSADGTGSAARFGFPFKLALGPDGDLYVADQNISRIRRVTPAGVVTTYAGGTSTTIEADYVDGAPDAARFNSPRDLAVAPNGDVYVADSGNSRIRRIVRSGASAASVETVAGNGQFSGPQSAVDGVGTAAGIRSPSAFAILGGGLFTGDASNLLRRVDLTTRQVTTVAGSRVNGNGFADGTGEAARFDLFEGLTAARDGSLLATMHPGAVRRITTAGVVTTIMSSGATSSLGGRTTDDGVTRARELFLEPSSVAVDVAGNSYVADKGLKTVRRITPSGQVSLVAGLAGSYHGGIDGVGSEAQFTVPNAIAVDGAGNSYVADQYSVRKIAADGRVTTLAGSPTEFGAINAAGTAARFAIIKGLAVDSSGNVFVGDGTNHAIRQIDPAGNVTTYAGALSQPPGATDGPRMAARFNGVGGLAFGPGGALYVADTGNCRLRKIASDGTVSTLPGGTGPCSATQPLALAVASDGSVFYTDAVANSVRQLLPNGTLLTVIPRSSDFLVHLGTNPSIYQPVGIALLGPKELVITTMVTQVLKATLP